MSAADRHAGRLGDLSSRVSALLLAIVLAGSLATLALKPWSRAVHRAADSLVAAEAGARGLAATPSFSKEEAASLAARLPELALAAPSEGQAMARLQDLVKARAGEAGARLLAVEPLEIETDAPLALLAARVRLAGDTASLQAFLHGVEAGPPRLIVRRLRVEVPPERGDVRLLAEAELAVPWTRAEEGGS